MDWLRRFEPRRIDAPRRPVRLGAHYDPDAFGRFSEAIARFIGTARYLVFQTVLVALWIAGNIVFHHDPHLFYLNLAFSTQAAYAAPLILLAQNRQAERDSIATDDDRRTSRRTQADAEFLARELMAARISLGRVEATLARMEEERERTERAEAS